MTEGDFFRAVLADPDDDVTRLAFADWLLENGQEARGEFIQAQVRLARWAEPGDPGEWADASRLPELKKREQQLLAAHAKEWAAAAIGRAEAHSFRRGFVDQVTLTEPQFAMHAEALFAAFPLRRVRFLTSPSQRLLASPLLARLSGLDFTGLMFGDAALRAILASPHLSGLTSLELNKCWLSDAGLEALAQSPLLGRLAHLGLANNRITLDGVRRLFRSPHWRKVRSFDLGGNPIDPQAQQYLTRSLAGTHDVSLLCVMLRMASRGEREYTCAPVRALAERAGKRPDPAAILAAGLGDGGRRVRSAAARMLTRLGHDGASALPGLMQRLFDRDPLVRDQVAPALARLVEELSPAMQTWMCLIANPLLTPAANLANALGREDLPGEVRAEFHAICFRRAAWRAGLGGPPVPKAPWVTAAEAAQWMAGHASRHAARHGPHEAERAAHRESAWLLARLAEALQKALPAEPPDRKRQKLP